MISRENAANCRRCVRLPTAAGRRCEPDRCACAGRWRAERGATWHSGRDQWGALHRLAHEDAHAHAHGYEDVHEHEYEDVHGRDGAQLGLVHLHVFVRVRVRVLVSVHVLVLVHVLAFQCE
jgi:hypothetical protein